MVVFGRTAGSLVLVSMLVWPLASCANSSLGRSLQDSLAADPRLTETAPTDADLKQPPPTQAELPADFPVAIPRYPEAVLQEVVPAAGPTNPEVATVWQTADSRDRVLAFYQAQLQTDGWQLQPASLTSPQGTFVAQRDTPPALQITVAISPVASPAPSPSPPISPNAGAEAAPGPTQFTIRYTPPTDSVVQATPSPSPSPDQEVFLGAEGISDGAIAPTTPTAPIAALPPNNYTDLDQAPPDLRSPLADLAQLGVLNLSASSQTKSASTNFSPNKPVSRREYARWLFDANNRLFRDRAAQQIRPANREAPAVFRDVPRTDPDFAAIQGLAEAGIIPSPLSGDATTVTFRPDAQLSRETMLLWKVPMDTRQPLPPATLDAIKQTWGFQDAARIEPTAQRAVLADFQNADLSNIRRVFGFTTLFQPKRPATRAEAAASLWHFGYQGDGISAQEALKGQ
ncbi:MAG: S-layer homology domain-containing protein [Leptolyngbyaceae cyanobacterium bins.349]|nr:S-layer homology domain-containing protein [Leptolyngbyaceae cyanobacterium bins.349]